MQDSKFVELLSSSIIYSYDRDILKSVLRKNADHFYVYVLAYPDGKPFYVGKGQRSRIFCHEADSKNTHKKSYKLNTIRALRKSGQPVHYYIDSFHSSDELAYAREKDLIHSIGRHDLGMGCLTNLTDGGEGISNLSDQSRRKHRNTLYGTEEEDDRSVANHFFQKLMTVRSVPIKPANDFRAEFLSPMNKPLKNYTGRMAAALAASAISNRVMLEEGCIIPRKLSIEDKEYVIENGVGKDILKVGMASIIPSRVPKDEAFKVSRSGVDYILENITHDLLLGAGIMMPVIK